MAWARLLGLLGLRGPSVVLVCVPRQLFYMPYRKQSSFLNRDIQLLPLSWQVRKTIAAAGYPNLKEFLKVPFHKWQLQVPGLTHQLRREIVYFIYALDLEDFIKAR